MKVIVSIIVLLASTSVFAAQTENELLRLLHKIKVDPLNTLGAIDGCEFSKDGTLVSASDNHGVCRIYRVSDGTEVGQITHTLINNAEHSPNGELNAVPFSYDGKFRCTGRNHDGTKVRRTSDWSLEKHLVENGETDGIGFSPNGRWLAAAEDGKVLVFQLPGFKRVAKIDLESWGSVNSISFSPDNTMVAYAASSGKVRVLKTSDWTLIRTFTNRNDKSLKSVRFSPDGKHLAYSGGMQSCFVRRVSDWTLVAGLVQEGNMVARPGDDNDSEDPNVEAVAWSIDGAYLFSSGVVDGVMRVWRSSDWSLLTTVQAQEKNRAIEFIDVSIDNKVVVGGDEGYIYIYQFTDT